MRLATVLLLLPRPRAATACPADWTPSPYSGTCFKVPPERSTSLFRCVELCEEHGGAPACIGSEEENAFVTAGLAATEGLWLGLYQNEKGLGPAKGWGRCVAGDAPSFTNWREGEPDDYHGYRQDCAWFEAGSGQWRALACDSSVIGDVRFDTFPWLVAELCCLCARGNASAAFADDREALDATTGYNQQLHMKRTMIVVSAAVAIAILPTLLLLGRTGWSWLRRGVDAAPGGSLRSLRRSPSRWSQGAASSAAVKGVLRAARASAAGRRLRVSFVMGQAGWALLVIGLTPIVMESTAHSIGNDVNDATGWLAPLGACLLGLALFPTDARAIRVVCAAAAVVWTGFGVLYIGQALAAAGHHLATDAYWFSNAALFVAGAAALAPTLRCRGDRAMQPRPALRRLWIASRLYFLGLGVINSWYGAARFAQGGYHTTYLATVGWSATSLLMAALTTSRNRGRIHRRLGRVGGRGTEAEEAAAVAALVGGSAPDAALERAVKLLRCLPASRLHAADLADNMAAAPAGPTLHARTEPAAMGQVTAFLSHSWSDEKEAPGAKHALVSRWAKRCQKATGIEPTFWLVALAHTRRTLPTAPHVHILYTFGITRTPRLVLQDKACIDQNNIQQSLACLPVFLAGCQMLLVVAGPTYCSRLWCVMELFTFARMGGAPERVEIHLIAHPDDNQTEARRRLTEQFATFDAAKAQCFLASDREHLLAVIEASFGDFYDFNRIARSLLTSRLHDALGSRSRGLADDVSESSLRTPLLPTKGYLEADGQVCIVSFPASLGQRAWNGMVGGGELNFACVWTGDNNSPTSDWYDPWVANVDEAVERGMTLLVYGHSDHPVENQFTHVSPLWGEQKYRLGAGQQAEVKHMNERGIRYKVFALGTGFVATGFTGDALVRAASDGPIALKD